MDEWHRLPGDDPQQAAAIGDAREGHILDASDSDLWQFRAHGGKLIHLPRLERCCHVRPPNYPLLPRCHSKGGRS